MILEIDNINLPINYTQNDLLIKCKNKLKIDSKNIVKIHKLKESIDARKKDNIHYVLNVGVEVIKYKNKFNYKEINIDYSGLKYKKIKYDSQPIVVGFGPSGMFAGLALSEMGLNPIIIEQGKDIDSRKIDVENFWTNRQLNTNSNVQFGEGGAGTFSDGKLNTNINSEYNKKVLNEFILAGAPKEIFYKSKPHIGSDNLPTVVKNIRNKIIKNGGKVLFCHKFINFNAKNGKVYEIIVKNLITNENITLKTNYLILAVGHSAIDTFEMLNSHKIHIEPKPFAIGVRIEQNQKKINCAQHGQYANMLGSADYKLVTHLDNGRSVFTFCMCPGGQVVASSSEDGTIVTNGMSNFARNLDNANSALLVNVKPEDFVKDSALDGLYYQRKYEKIAFELGGNNYNAPCQKVMDFVGVKAKINKNNNIIIKKCKIVDDKIIVKNFKVNNDNKIKPTYKPDVTYCDISKCLPSFVTESLRQALPILNKKIHHFADYNCLLTAIETRTSCPIQIVRDDNWESSIQGLYPIGEGAGYAGGIMTSSLDGIYCAEKIYDNIKSNN